MEYDWEEDEHGEYKDWYQEEELYPPGSEGEEKEYKAGYQELQQASEVDNICGVDLMSQAALVGIISGGTKAQKLKHLRGMELAQATDQQKFCINVYTAFKNTQEELRLTTSWFISDVKPIIFTMLNTKFKNPLCTLLAVYCTPDTSINRSLLKKVEIYLEKLNDPHIKLVDIIRYSRNILQIRGVQNLF